MSEPTVKVRIGADEEYPVYWAELDRGQWPSTYSPVQAEVSQEALARWDRVVDEYAAVQQEMIVARDNAVSERSKRNDS